MGQFDPVGAQTLEVMGTAGRYNTRLFSLIKPWLRGSVLDVGAGSGNFIPALISGNLVVSALDINPDYLKILSQTYPAISVYHLDLQTRSLPDRLVGSFDTIIMLNVLEHIAADSQSVANLYKLLKPGGRLIIIVPAHQAVFGTLDKLLSHYRRYSATGLSRLLESHHFKILRLRYLSSLLILGWWLNGKVFRQKIIHPFQIRLIDPFIPLLASVEDLVRPPFGLSVFCVAEK